MKRFICIVLVFLMIPVCALAADGALNNFSTYDMSGNIVTQEIFSNYDLTMVNVWTTWCKYCIYEMPELAKLKDMLPENVNLITICDDATIEPISAYQILSSAGAGFQTLMGTQEIYDQFLYQVQSYPTTFFLNSEGVPVGEEIIGIPVLEEIAETYLGVIREVLSSMEITQTEAD